MTRRLAVLALFPCLVARAADGPSFDCAKVTGQVTRAICASPELSALDRQLAEHYRALQAQPATDRAALMHDEVAWLHDVRDRCADDACIAAAYRARDAELLARSRHAASPAADEETQPFAVDAGLWTAAQSLRGTRCELGDRLLREAGYGPVPGALPVVGNGSLVVERRRREADFAFLIDTRAGCAVVDVAALPPVAQAGTLLQCAVPGEGPEPLSSGVGLRRPGQRVPVAYWEANVGAGRLIRQPLGVLGWGRAIRCQQPETGE